MIIDWNFEASRESAENLANNCIPGKDGEQLGKNWKKKQDSEIRM